MSEVSYNLVSLLDEMDMSQAELSRKTGITKGSISLYVSGKSDMSASNVVKIADALGVTTDRLLGTGFDKAVGSADANLTKLLVIYARLTPEQRAMLVKIAEVVAE